MREVARTKNRRWSIGEANASPWSMNQGNETRRREKLSMLWVKGRATTRLRSKSHDNEPRRSEQWHVLWAKGPRLPMCQDNAFQVI